MAQRAYTHHQYKGGNYEDEYREYGREHEHAFHQVYGHQKERPFEGYFEGYDGVNYPRSSPNPPPPRGRFYGVRNESLKARPPPREQVYSRYYDEIDSHDHFEDRYEPRLQPSRNPIPRGQNHEEEVYDYHFEDRHGPRRNPRPYNPRDDYYYKEHDYYGDGYGQRKPPRPYYRRRGQHDEEDEFKHIKINIPNFNGVREPEAYLEWERKVELAFNFRDYPERKKLELITQKFSWYALDWWHKIVKERKSYGEEPIDSWCKLQREMRRKFVPCDYERKLQRMEDYERKKRAINSPSFKKSYWNKKDEAPKKQFYPSQHSQSESATLR